MLQKCHGPTCHLATISSARPSGFRRAFSILETDHRAAILSTALDVVCISSAWRWDRDWLFAPPRQDFPLRSRKPTSYLFDLVSIELKFVEHLLMTG